MMAERRKRGMTKEGDMTGRASRILRKGRGKTARFQGAEVVQKLSDVFERGPSDDDVDP